MELALLTEYNFTKAVSINNNRCGRPGALQEIRGWMNTGPSKLFKERQLENYKGASISRL